MRAREDSTPEAPSGGASAAQDNARHETQRTEYRQRDRAWFGNGRQEAPDFAAGTERRMDIPVSLAVSQRSCERRFGARDPAVRCDIRIIPTGSQSQVQGIGERPVHNTEGKTGQAGRGGGNTRSPGAGNDGRRVDMRSGGVSL